MSIAMEPLVSRVLPDEKAEFQTVCEAIGTTPSNAIRIFVSRFNSFGGFPFEVRNTKGINISSDDPRILKQKRASDGTLVFESDDYNPDEDIYNAYG